MSGNLYFQPRMPLAPSQIDSIKWHHLSLLLVNYVLLLLSEIINGLGRSLSFIQLMMMNDDKLSTITVVLLRRFTTIYFVWRDECESVQE